MRKNTLFASVLLLAGAALAADPPPSADTGGGPGGGAYQASNISNPNISVIGWFQGEAGKRQTQPDEPAFQLKEAEIAFQSVVDPYARADFFASATEDGVTLEEGYITWFALPANLGLKVGKFRANAGKFNRTHPGETAFADRPIAAERFLGEEGLSGTGASLSWQVPVPWFFVNLDAEAITSPDASEVPSFGKAQKKDLTYVGRLSGYWDLTEAANVTLGLNHIQGPAGEELDSLGVSSTTLRSQMNGVDVTFRWKNPRRLIYHSVFWQTEVFQSKKDLSTTQDMTSLGLFSHLEFQFARRWRVGGRYDYAESPNDKTNEEKGGLLYLTFVPSEFSLVSLQGRHELLDNGTKEDLGFLKVTFNIGPHGAHPF